MTIYDILGLGGVFILFISFMIFMYFDKPIDLYKGQK